MPVRPDSQPAPKPSSWRTKGSVGLGVTAFFATAFYLDFQLETDRAQSMLPDIAAHRNICSVRSFEPLSKQAGGLAFRLTVDLQPGMLPEKSNKSFNALISKTTFTDGPRSGGSLGVQGPVDAPIVHMYSDSENTPDGPQNIAVVVFDNPPTPDVIYHVYRHNTVVTETVLFWLIDHQSRGSGVVPCGELPRISP